MVSEGTAFDFHAMHSIDKHIFKRKSIDRLFWKFELEVRTQNATLI